MIYDTLDNLSKYIPEKKRAAIEKFIKNIHADMPEGFYEIDGEEMFAKVMSYEGKAREDCAIEAHNQYIDIQFTLIGVEGIDIFERKKLKKRTEYSQKDDILFLEEDKEACVQISNLPGYFSMIFPREAHRPQIAVNRENSFIKKGVIKIKEQYYE